ncbi:MAG: hydroxymethylglutaryl-CoA lyase, partial [Rectinemataceae bacterium]|nr:hydroxymethylglutaryl-CoA lyase [Rectinemataceae bacterium]
KKISLIKRLAECGLREIEVGGFVSPKAIPQFQDIKEMIKGVIDIKGPRLTALVPNLTGAQNAVESGIKKIVFVFSASRSHNMNNVKRTPEESIEEMKKIKAWTSSSCPNVEIRLNLATVFGCPFEKEVKKEDVFRYVEKTGEIGVLEITLCDTVGYGNPRQVEEIVGVCMEKYPAITFGVHFHNTRGLGLANNLAAYKSGIRSFDSSIGGLGGCPFAPGASGNVATEDAVFMFNEMGIQTSVDIGRLLKTSQYLKETLPDVPLTSALFRAGLPVQTVSACSH